jgi:hypothetical protein
MVCLGTLVGRRLISRASTLPLSRIVQVAVRMDGPAIRLDLPKRLLDPLLAALGTGLWLAFPLANVLKFSPLALLLSSTSCIDGSRKAVCTLMDVGNMLRRLVVANDVLPSVTLFTQNSVSVVLWEAADALDGRGLILSNGAVESRRAV